MIDQKCIGVLVCTHIDWQVSISLHLAWGAGTWLNLECSLVLRLAITNLPNEALHRVGHWFSMYFWSFEILRCFSSTSVLHVYGSLSAMTRSELPWVFLGWRNFILTLLYSSFSLLKVCRCRPREAVSDRLGYPLTLYYSLLAIIPSWWVANELDAITERRTVPLKMDLKVESGWCDCLGGCRDDDEGLVYCLLSSLPVSRNWGPLNTVTSK